MILRYAGVPLLVEDPGFDFQVWLEQSLSMQGLSLFGEAEAQGRNRPRGVFLGREENQSAPQVGLPKFNYTSNTPAEWKLNTLWWPTGAMRHSIGLFLVDNDSFKEINSTVKSGSGKADLEIGEEDGEVVTFKSMYMLPPHRITGGAEELWLLCLVDQRYFWPLRSTQDLSVTTSTTWDSLLSTVTNLLGASSVFWDTIDPTYANPSPDELSRKYENAALLLDAIAASLGKRVALAPSGHLHIKSATSDKDAFDTAVAGIGEMPAAGGEKNGCGSAPETIAVTFPKVLASGEYFTDGSVYGVDISPSLSDLTCQPSIISGARKVFHSTAPARYQASNDPLPINYIALMQLAQKIANDHLQWTTFGYDQRYVGIIDWRPTGYDDYVIWSAGSQHRPENSLLIRELGPDKEGRDVWRSMLQDYDFSTRMVSQPANIAVSTQLSHFSTAPTPPTCYLLTPCDLGSQFTASGDDLAPYVGQVIQYATDGNCYTVSETASCAGATALTTDDIDGLFSECGMCDECAKLTSCIDDTNRHVRAYQVGLFPDTVVGRVMKIDGECFTIDDVHFTCPSTPLDLGGIYTGPYYNDCGSCGCHKFVDCDDSQNIKYVKSATHDGNDFDLDSLTEGEIVREGMADCWEYHGVVQESSNCSSAVSLTIEETYPDCPNCTAWELTECGTSNTITTNSDLSEYSLADVLKRAEDGKCYYNRTAVVFSGSDVEFTVESDHDTCDQCQNPKYKLTDASCCDPDCEDDCDSLTEIVTDEGDLSGSVGSIVKYEGRCYTVSEADADPSDPVTHAEPLDFSGPFDTCEECLQAPMELTVVTSVTMEATGLVVKSKKIVFNGSACKENENTIPIGEC